MNKEKILGIIRHLLTFGGGFLIAKGHIDDATLAESVGAITSIVGTLWSIFAPEKKATT